MFIAAASPNYEPSESSFVVKYRVPSEKSPGFYIYLFYMMQLLELAVNGVDKIPEIVELLKCGICGELFNPTGQTK